MTEEILIDLKIPGAEDKIDALTVSINELNEAQKKLVAENKELEKSGDKNSKQYLDNARQIELNKQKIQENTASRKGLVQAMVSEEGSIKSLRVANAELIKQRDLISTKTDTGRQRIQEINKQLDANNIKIRENSSHLEKQKINIGNYASALDNVHPGLGRFATAMSSGVAPIAAIGAGLGALVGLYAKSTIGTKDLEFASNQLSSAINLLGNNFASLFSSGKDGEGFFSGLTNSLISQFDAGIGALSRLSALNQEKLEDLGREAKQALTTQQNLLEDNADILEKIADSQVDYNEKLALSNDAIQNIRAGATSVREIRQQELSILEQQLGLDVENEALQDAILDKKLQISQEARREERLVNNIEKIQSNIKDTEQKRLDTIIKQNEKLAEQTRDKSVEQLEKDSQLRNDIADSDLERELERINESLSVKEETKEAEIEIEENFTGLIEEQYTKRSQFALDYDDLLTRLIASGLTRQQAAATIQARQAGELESRIGAVTNAFGRQTVAYKISASAQAVANTWKGVTEILGEKSILPFPLSVIAKGIAVAGTIASGFGAVKNINAAAGGGNFMTKGPTLLMVGDNPGGVEHVSVTPISGKGTTRVVEGSGLTRVAMAGGGNLTAIGSNETRIAASSAQGQFDARDVASLMDMVKIVLVRESYEAAQMQHDQTAKLSKVV